MNLRAKLLHSWRAKAVASLVLALLGALVSILPLTQSLSFFSYDVPFFFRHPACPDDILIVYMDDESRKKLDQPVEGSWDREMHMQLLNKLFALRARAVVFDILFDQPWKHPSVDNEFADAIRSHGNVILGAKLESSGAGGQFSVLHLLKPVKPLALAALWGVGEVRPDTDGTVRMHAYNPNYTDLAWQAALLAGTTLPSRTLPAWINYYGPAGQVPHTSYHLALSNALSPDAVSNKIVFVGKAPFITYQGSKSSDEFRIPFTRWDENNSTWPGGNSPGVEIQATTALNLLHKDWLSRLPLFLEAAIILASAIYFGALIPNFRPPIALVAALAGGVALAAFGIILPLHFHSWFNWAAVCFVQTPAALLWYFFRPAPRTGLQPAIAEPVLQTPTLRPATVAVPVSGQPPAPVLPAPAPAPAESTTQCPGASSPLATPPPNVPRGERELPAIPDHELVKYLGRGGYGQVWLARTALGRYRAVKFVFGTDFNSDKGLVREFQGIEAFEPISRQHPGFVDILQVGPSHKTDYFYYVMELADDQTAGQNINPEVYIPKTLDSELKARLSFPCDECAATGMALAEAVRELHERGLVHRDIKPANIIFIEGIPKLADVGLVAPTDDANSLVGTLGYMPPEGRGSPLGDIYSLGKVIYQMLTGREASKFPDLPTIPPADSEAKTFNELNRILLKACAFKPEKRFQTAAELHLRLKRIAKRPTSRKPSP